MYTITQQWFQLVLLDWRRSKREILGVHINQLRSRRRGNAVSWAVPISHCWKQKKRVGTILTCDALSVVSGRGMIFISAMIQRTASLYCAMRGITWCTAQQRRPQMMAIHKSWPYLDKTNIQCLWVYDIIITTVAIFCLKQYHSRRSPHLEQYCPRRSPYSAILPHARVRIVVNE